MMSSTHRYAIVTPYHKESRQLLERCIRSVQGQTVQADHFMVADGHPQDWIDGIPGVHHIRLAQSHADYGNTPRCIGAMRAAADGFDGIGLLDADNWLDADHVATCLKAASTVRGTCDFVIANRRFCRPDGSDMNIPEEAGHIDTNAFFYLPGSYETLSFWGSMPRELSPICDRVIAEVVLSRSLQFVITDKITVNYHCLWSNMYLDIGEQPPPEANHKVDHRPIRKWLRALTPAEFSHAEMLSGCRLDPCTILPDPTRANMSEFELGKQLFLDGIEHLQLGDADEAEYRFRESLRRVPNRPSTLMNLSAAMLKQKRYEETMDIIGSVLALEPDSPEAWLNLAIAQMEIGQLSDSQCSFEKLKSLDPYYAEAFLHHGLLHMKTGAYEQAIEQFNTALELAPDMEEAERHRQEARIQLNPRTA
jgi:Flp pilus assembly protein TadD